MINIVKSEILKQKRSFNNKVIWLAPFITITLAILLMSNQYAFSGSYNWWYILLLPFTFTYICSTMITKDEKKNYHGLLSVQSNKKNLWYAKVIVATGYLLATTVIFLLLLIVGGRLLDFDVPIDKAIIGSGLLFVTFAWQVVLFMYTAQKVGVFLNIMISVICNLFVACLCAVGRFWWIPFAIPVRLMCSAIGVMPNGTLITETEKQFINNDVILPGVFITVVLYIGLSWLTAQAFNQKEV